MDEEKQRKKQLDEGRRWQKSSLMKRRDGSRPGKCQLHRSTEKTFPFRFGARFFGIVDRKP